MIAAQGVWKGFGAKEVLRGADLSVEGGELVALMGENGSGKTTLLRAMAGLIRPDSGTIRIGGEVLCRSNLQARRRLSLCGHQSGLYLDLTVEENIRVFSSLRAGRVVSTSHRWAEGGDLAPWGLGGLRDSRVRSLSHGQKKRVALFLAFHAGAEGVLLDEPFAGLDEASADWLEEVLESELAKGTAVLLTTHERIPRPVARVCRLAGGRVAAG